MPRDDPRFELARRDAPREEVPREDEALLRRDAAAVLRRELLERPRELEPRRVLEADAREDALRRLAVHSTQPQSAPCRFEDCFAMASPFGLTGYDARKRGEFVK